jgi:hypothetical protein
MFAHHEYLVAWTIYVVGGIGCCVVWWKITSHIGNRLLREFLRGLAVVVIFTPWFATDSTEFYAPAIVVLLMDVMLTGAGGGLAGGMALLFTGFLMLLVLALREFRRHPRH